MSKVCLITYIKTAINTFKRLDCRVDLNMCLPVFSHVNHLSETGFYFTESVVFPKWEAVDYSDDRVTIEVLNVIWKNLEEKLEMVFTRIIAEEEIARKKKELTARICMELKTTVAESWKVVDV